MKVGIVALIGRPNTGKSTLINNLVGHKISITSPKPQTTRFPIYAVFEDERGQIIFVDTPGIFAKTPDQQSKNANLESKRILRDNVDVVLYVIDHTRQRGLEENRVLGMLRKVEVPKILVVNKADVIEPSYMEQYKFLEDEFDNKIEISAIKAKNLSTLLAKIFEYLKEGERIVNKEDMAIPAMNMSSNLYLEEIIREKLFLVLREELPYAVKVVVDTKEERKNGVIYIKARVITREKRYRRMIIGAGAQRIKQIGMMARKELELSTGNKIYLELTVEAE